MRKNAPQKELVWVGRLMVLAIAVISILIASDPESKVLGLVSYAWAGFGAAFGPIVILSVLWKRITAYGALSGMIAGALTVVAWAEKLRVSPNTPNGRTLRVRGKGVRRKDDTMGNLLVTIQVKVPEHLSEAARNALQEYAQKAGQEDPRAWI